MAANPSWIHGNSGVSWSVDHIYYPQLMQEVLVILIVAAAVFFIGRMVYRQFFAKEAKCDSCGFAEAVED